MEHSTQPKSKSKDIETLLSIDGSDLKHLVEAGLNWLRTNQQIVNSLNVFPVPDGDTGTNMVLTMQSAVNEISQIEETNVGKVAHNIAQGALLGARGNSGVILSQLWRGFARTLDNYDSMDTALFIRSLNEGKITAYKGVVRPVEGTILTVAKDVAAAAEQLGNETDNLFTILEKLVVVADESVQRTPELLPILKQAGVVDSGGKGLFFILDGMLRYLKGHPLDTPVSSVQPLEAMELDGAMDSIEPGQDYEVVVDFEPFKELNLDAFYTGLSKIGTSIQVGEGDSMYRMHIHVPTDKRYEPIDYVMKLGTITKVAMENLVEQMEKENKKSNLKFELAPIQPGQIAVVAISPGIGISRILASLGVAALVEGGQTMNPSTEQILNAFENLPTDRIIILPNNKNIILAAQSAATMSKKNVTVIPSKNIPQGLSALLRLDPDGDLNEVIEQMNDSLTDIETGEITRATRNAEINGVKVKKDQVIVLHNGQLIAAVQNLEDAIFTFLEDAKTTERERITIFYGADISKQEVNQMADKIREKYSSQEIEIHEGGQPHYQFIISVE
jgi:DAK2 domain fusion protein YloV